MNALLSFPARQLRTDCCGRTRQLRNCEVRTLLDHVDVRCAPGKGCRKRMKRSAA